MSRPDRLGRLLRPATLWRLRLPLCLFWLALAVRVVYLFQVTECPYFDHILPAFDQHNFYVGAKALAQGDLWASSPNENYSALYKYGLGILWWLGGGADPQADEYPIFLFCRAVQLFFGAVLALLLYLETSRYFSRRVAVLASLLYALCGPMLFHEALLSREFPAAFLSFVAFMLLGRLARRPSLGGVLSAAAALSLTYQCRTNAILFVPFAAVFAWRQALAGLHVPKRAAWLIAGAACFWILCLPLMIRNVYRLGRAPQPPPAGINHFTVSPQGSFEILSGNHPDVREPGFRPTDEARRLAQEGPATYSRTIGILWKWVRSDPVEFAWLYGRKLYWTFFDYEVPDNHSYYVWRQFSALLDLPTGHAAIHAALMILGALWVWPHRKALALPYLFLLASTLPLILIYSVSRFRAQAFVYWIPFAAWAIDCLFERLRTRKFVRFAAGAAAAAALGWLFWLPEPAWLLKALHANEQHAPETRSGEILFPSDAISPPERGHYTVGVNRPFDYTNLIAAYLNQLERARTAPLKRRPDRTRLFLRDAERFCRVAMTQAEHLRISRATLREFLAHVHRYQYAAARERRDLGQMIQAGRKWLRLDFAQPPLALQLAFHQHEAVQGRSPTLGDLEAIEALYRAAVLLDPGQAAAWGNLVQLSIDRQDPAAARFFLNRLSATSGGHPSVQALREAIDRRFGAAGEIDADKADRLEREADALAEQGNLPEAIRRYQAALPDAFERSRLHHKLAARSMCADPVLAGRHLEIVLMIAPADVNAHLQLALLFEKTNVMRAVWHMKRILEIQPDPPFKTQIQAAVQRWPETFRPE